MFHTFIYQLRCEIWEGAYCQAVCWIILVLEVYSRVHFWLISSPYYCCWKICWFSMNENKSVATLAKRTTKNLNVLKCAGSNPVGSMYISFIHLSLNSNKINLILYSAATNMQWKNLKALTSEATTLLWCNPDDPRIDLQYKDYSADCLIRRTLNLNRLHTRMYV